METGAKFLILFIDGPDDIAIEQAEEVVHTIGDQCVLQVVDVNDDPDLAEVVGVHSVPTLVRLSPDPRRKVANDLSDPAEVAAYLGRAWIPSTAIPV